MFHWRRGGSGLYYVRDHPGLGPSEGSVVTVPTGGGGRFYAATFNYGPVSIAFRERGTHDSIIKKLEAEILQHIPDATFKREF